MLIQVNNRYIVSLAVSDLIIGIEGIPLFTVYVVNGDRWPLGSIACETWLFLDYTLCLVSILTVLLITADRYMSVCHTAKYLKWQSPTKTQVLIIFSWVLPALMFGVMIYGWSFLSGEERAEHSTECSAPFLSNPYVNMGMYVAYYWTTLIAMLILYKVSHLFLVWEYIIIFLLDCTPFMDFKSRKPSLNNNREIRFPENYFCRN